MKGSLHSRKHAGPPAAPLGAQEMATITTKEAETFLAGAKALAHDYAAKGPTRPTLTVWVRCHTAFIQCVIRTHTAFMGHQRSWSSGEKPTHMPISGDDGTTDRLCQGVSSVRSAVPVGYVAATSCNRHRTNRVTKPRPECRDGTPVPHASARARKPLPRSSTTPSSQRAGALHDSPTRFLSERTVRESRQTRCPVETLHFTCHLC